MRLAHAPWRMTPNRLLHHHAVHNTTKQHVYTMQPTLLQRSFSSPSGPQTSTATSGVPRGVRVRSPQLCTPSYLTTPSQPAALYAGVGLTLLTGLGLVAVFQQQREARRQGVRDTCISRGFWVLLAPCAQPHNPHMYQSCWQRMLQWWVRPRWGVRSRSSPMRASA